MAVVKIDFTVIFNKGPNINLASYSLFSFIIFPISPIISLVAEDSTLTGLFNTSSAVCRAFSCCPESIVKLCQQVPRKQHGGHHI